MTVDKYYQKFPGAAQDGPEGCKNLIRIDLLVNIQVSSPIFSFW
jgi:hypothetical protein